jgi:predicted 3-demethylubiquinone-9 3-methyltransferase (glyoxalase superfamily)
MPTITPFLWFDDQAEQAAEFYVSVFPNSRIDQVARYSEAGPGPARSVMTVRFSLDGNEFLALNGGPTHYGFDESISFMVNCKTEQEVDHYWSALTEGGEEIACGWLKDRYGLRWQIVPEGLPALLGDSDPERAKRAAQAMMGMKKLDLKAMREAADGVAA